MTAFPWVTLVDQTPPLIPGVPSGLLLVWAEEFGITGTPFVARAWQSTEPNQPVKFYLDQQTYGLDTLWEISGVTHFVVITQPGDTRPAGQLSLFDQP